MTTKRRRHLLAAGIVGCLSAALIVGTSAAWGLAPSAFESTDGNTVATVQDWDHLAPATSEADEEDTLTGPDDESFTQGTKSDTMVPTIEFGSIPPNKSDLTRMRIASETIGGEVFLYVAWNRSNTLGSANMNFEFNNGSAGISTNGFTPNRLPNDVLITFDFANGGNHVDLGLAQWAQTPCVANGAKEPDCWGDFVDLDASGFADGSVSADGRFGEAAINLTDAGVFTPSQCTALGFAYLTSRSSNSFTAALKDFVPPAPISISTCGDFQINKTAKHKDAATSPDLGATFEVKSGTTVVRTVQTNSSTGIVCVTGLPPGPYTVDEVSGAAGYQLDPSVEPVTVTLGSTCAANQVSFENVPLSKITVSFESLVTGGTASNITCQGPGGAIAPTPADGTNAYDDTSEVYTNLTPGIYTCTIDVDP